MQIIIDGQKLPTAPRTTKDVLVVVKSMARTLHWRTLYDPAKDVVFISTAPSKTPLGPAETPAVEELESIRLQDKVVCIDAGHGGSDPGAIGPQGTQEKDNTLAIALLLKEKLENNGATVVMTRTREEDELGGLDQRMSVANDSEADLLVSIHNDAFTSSTASGTTTFHYGGEASIRLAACIQKTLVNALGTKDRGVRFASFYLLRCAAVPAAALIETAFISNPEEELLLASNDGREKIADGIYDGIVRYFKV